MSEQAKLIQTLSAIAENLEAATGALTGMIWVLVVIIGLHFWEKFYG